MTDSPRIRISEIYRSKQGEGFLTGTESWFVRTSGCNLRCWFCDTPFASWEPEGSTKTLDEIIDELKFEEARHIVLTGGEPMLPSGIVELTRRFKSAGFHITIETAGTIFQPVECDLVSISPKFSNSTPDVNFSVGNTRAGEWSTRHEQRRHQPDVIRQLIAEYKYQIKFVLDQESDCKSVFSYLEEFPKIQRDRVLLMAQGVTVEALTEKQRWLEPFCLSNGFTYCPRKHIEWYGNLRGT